MTLPQAHLLSIGETISALSRVPALPEENWRRTAPGCFFLPDGEVVNSFGQSVLGSHLTASPFKIQFKVFSPSEIGSTISNLLGRASTQPESESGDAIDPSRVVLLTLNNGGVSVASCAESDAWVGRLEIASRPARPDSILRDSAVCSALAERLQICAPSELVVRVPRFEHCPVLFIAVENDPAFAQSYANISVDVADSAQAEIAVVHGTSSFAHHRLTLRLGRDARVTQLWAHLGAENHTESQVLLERKVKLASRAQFFDASIFAPSALVRVVSNITPEGEGASAQCGTAVVAAGNAIVDYEPLQDHISPQAQTHLRAKMIAGQRGKAIFQGLINVEREAPGTNASQVNKNLVLSKRARVDSMPRLRILPDEVACKHGSATGELDSKQIHYLMTRGFSELAAKELVVRGFVREGLSQLPESSPLLNWANTVLDQALERVLK
ncbi:MAG: SufD family Fe-S cluster assembly protein [Betaproteobacteria bacterium]|nr:SufD family Fe-S cluster assembly protein [Betaproteobacteria bacterium]